MTYIMEPLCQARLYWAEREDLFVMITRIDALGVWLVEELRPIVNAVDSDWCWRIVSWEPTVREAMAPYRHLNPNILCEEPV